jgi:hypothetical protein
MKLSHPTSSASPAAENLQSVGSVTQEWYFEILGELRSRCSMTPLNWGSGESTQIESLGVLNMHSVCSVAFNSHVESVERFQRRSKCRFFLLVLVWQ